MRHESRKIELVRAWLAKTQEDLTMANRALQPPEIVGDAVFHCQQAVEKALKGYLAWHDQEFSRTHDLRRLVEQCQALDTAFSQVQETALVLTPFASVTRYPDFSTPPSVEEAREMVRIATVTVDFVRSRLPDSIQA